LNGRLDFSISQHQISVGVMKHRFTNVVVCLLYLSVALVFGVVHHHHNDGPLGDHHDCAACAWHLNAAADVPWVAPITFGCVLETALLLFEAAPLHTPTYSFSPSRAPPVTPA
jgi:hypothetical protein